MQTYKVINETGLAEIAKFLQENHKSGHEMTQQSLQAWADDAKTSLDNDNPPIIELRSWDCVHGRTMTFEISAAGVDEKFFDDAE